jgi:hypothetical protein
VRGREKGISADVCCKCDAILGRKTTLDRLS